MLNSMWLFFSALLLALVAPLIAHTIKLAEFRQTWISDLRKDIAEYLGLSRKWAMAYGDYLLFAEEKPERKELLEKGDKCALIRTDALVVLWRIHLRINPLPNPQKDQDDQFLKALDALLDFKKVKPDDHEVVERWRVLAEDALSQGRNLLKREWDVTKQPFPIWVNQLSARFRSKS